MQRKWMIAVVTMFSVCALIAGVSFADDEEGPLHVLMEKVNKSSNAIKKATRTAVAYKKTESRPDILKNTEELIKLSKEARELGKDAVKKAAKTVKDPAKRWIELTDAFTKELEKFQATASKSGTDQAAAKKAYGLVSQSCTNCHNDFRVEEDSF
jgi:cytochrome c556